MPFVLDASVTMAWAFDDESHPVATLALARMSNDQVWVPAIWWYEVRNALLVSEWNERSTQSRSDVLLRYLSDLPVLIDESPEEETVFQMARKHHLSFYDATYLELALRNQVALATLDRKLRIAARKESVETLQAAGR